MNWSQPKYCEPLFRLLMRSLNITVTTQQGRAVNIGAQKIDIGFYAKLIVYMLGGRDGDWCAHLTLLLDDLISMTRSFCSVIEHLRTLFDALDSFYHPSNMNRSLKLLLYLMQHVAWSLCLRLRRERFSKDSWVNKVHLYS